MAKKSTPTYQEIIFRLQTFWMKNDCLILQPYNSEVGAGTLNPATFLRVLGPEPWRCAYVEPSKRPKDGRYGDNPNRVQQFLQYQVILKPPPDNVLALYIDRPMLRRIAPAVAFAPISSFTLVLGTSIVSTRKLWNPIASASQ